MHKKVKILTYECDGKLLEKLTINKIGRSNVMLNDCNFN